MKRPQWITAGIAIFLVIGLYAASTREIFGNKPKSPAGADTGSAARTGITTDSVLVRAKQNLSPEQASRISFLEKSITRGDVQAQQVHIYHQLAAFWHDTARIFEPYAWYMAELGRLENSEKSLTFAAHLFLDNLRLEENPGIKRWKALQARDLFERSLKINPANDSSEVALGAVYLFGGLETPMEGIQKIRKVVERQPENVYAQMTLGHASVLSGQLDKAVERFTKVVTLQPGNLEAVLSLAEVFERQGDRAQAVVWYKKSIPLITIAGLKKEVELRIAELSKK